jgi:hypothetical protein
MDVLASLVAHLQPPLAVQPGQGALHPPAITPRSCAGAAPLARNPRDDVTRLQHPTAARLASAFVRVQLVGSLPRPSARPGQRGHGVHPRRPHLRIVGVRRRMPDRQRDTAAADHAVALRARLAPARRIRPGFFSPPGAGTLPEASEARGPSMWSAHPSRSSRRRWRASHTPAACQSRTRRQQATPLPHPISWGSRSQGRPVLGTQRIPAKAARWPMQGRPPVGLGGASGTRGAIIAHSSPDKSCLAIRP